MTDFRCNVPCKDYCPPCNRRCFRSCPHGTCTKICGLPCDRCEKPCEWRCDHLWCTQICSAPCDRYLCPMWCHIQLPCGHSCVGVCGELCPPCRTCSPESFPAIFFTDEEEAKNARFVVLLPCKHCVEVKSLDKWLSMTSGGSVQKIVVNTCPICRSIISNRNLPLVKDSFSNIREAMIKIHGAPEVLNYKKMENECAIIKLQKFRTDLKAGPSRTCVNKKVQLFTQAEEYFLLKYLKSNELDKNGYSAFSFVLCCLQNILTCVTSHWNCYEDIHQLTIKSQFIFLMKQMLKNITRFGKQQHCDFSYESRRFVHFAELIYLYNKPSYKVNKDKPEIQEVLRFTRSILDPKPYTIHKEVELELNELKKRIIAAPSISVEEKEIILTAFPEHFKTGENA
ncbi:NFX1-type zinc finger-containing protein 1 [Homalodisca vitripennis]|nr:NFX1-type zinc finger-containing protein 1 [Homalodisca vitripennis]